MRSRVLVPLAQAILAQEQDKFQVPNLFGVLSLLSFALHHDIRCPTVAGGSKTWLVAGGPCTRICNIKRGSAFCKVAVRRQFNGHVRVPQQSFQPGHTAVNEGQKSTVKSKTMRTAGLRLSSEGVRVILVKGSTYGGARPELRRGGSQYQRCGGGWSEETRVFLSQLASARARSELPLTRRRAEQAWV